VAGGDSVPGMHGRLVESEMSEEGASQQVSVTRVSISAAEDISEVHSLGLKYRWNGV
jgi:hypothetical protein